MRTVLDTIKSLPAGTRSWMQKDIALANPPELDAIAGPILLGAERYGMALEVIPQLVTDISALLRHTSSGL